MSLRKSSRGGLRAWWLDGDGAILPVGGRGLLPWFAICGYRSMMTLYNRKGQAVAYIADDGQSIYLYGGKPVAWLSGEAVYSYGGRYLGWLQNGWVWDRSGYASFFTNEAHGGPVKPARQARPARGARGARPARGAREARPARPTRQISWSRVSDEQFFEQ